MNRHTVIQAYVQGTQDAMMKELIAKALEKTGIHPVNCHVFTEEDFAPSKAPSSVAHVLHSFPADFPSSDPAKPTDDTRSESDPSDDDSHLSDSESDKELDFSEGMN